MLYSRLKQGCKKTKSWLLTINYFVPDNHPLIVNGIKDPNKSSTQKNFRHSYVKKYEYEKIWDDHLWFFGGQSLANLCMGNSLWVIIQFTVLAQGLERLTNFLVHVCQKKTPQLRYVICCWYEGFSLSCSFWAALIGLTYNWE